MRKIPEFVIMLFAVVNLIVPVAWGQSLTLDHVDGLQGADSIVSRQEITFHLRLTIDNRTYWGISNGFRFIPPMAPNGTDSCKGR